MKSSKCFLLACIVLLTFAVTGLKAQISITTPYPSPAQSLTRGLDTSLLTVQVVFTAACDNDTVTLGLAPGVTYVSGSIAAIPGNTTAGFSIAEVGSPSGRPKFVIRGVTTSGNIRFTILRIAGCGSAASGKDSVAVAGSCGTVTENNSTINSYNLYSPALSLTPPAVLNNAVLNTSYSRTIAMTNGGNGCLDTLRYFVVYTSGGMVNTATGNAITANGVSFTPVSVNGDTLFYKIYGATLFGGDRLLCNGETVTIVEPVKVAKCNAVTTYGARWGRPGATFCQTATGSGTITMAAGVPNVTVLSSSTTAISGTNMCSDAVMQAMITNNATETVPGAATAFSIIQLLGIDNGESINVRTPVIISNVVISNGAGGWVPLTATGGSAGRADTIRLSQLLTDPDGVGGLKDADGDGQFDDLPAGASVTIRYNVTYTCQPSCNGSSHSGSPTYQSTFSGQCGTAYTGTKTTASAAAGNFGSRTLTSSSQSGPSDIIGGQTVTLRINASRDFSGLTTNAFNCRTDQLVMKVILPKGFSLAAGRYYPVSANTATNTIATYTNPALISTNPDTAYIIGKRSAGGNYSTFSFEADVALSCATYGGSSSLSYTVTYICDSSCACQEQWFCGTYALKAHCSSTCASGGLTLNGSQFRRSTTGYTSPYASRYADTAALSVAQLRYAMPYDTLRGTFPGVLSAGTNSLSFSNHYFELSYPQLGNANVLTAYSAVLRVKNILTSAVSTATLLSATSTIVSGKHFITYNLTSSGLAINAGDSVTLTPLFGVLTNSGLSSAPVQLSGITARYYSTVSPSATQYTCDSWGGELYLSQPGLNRSDGTGSIVNNGCSTYTYTGSLLYIGASGDVYPNEVRPLIVLDSVRAYITSGDNFAGNYSLRSFGVQAKGYGAGNYIDQTLTPISLSADGTKATFINDGSWAKGDYVSNNSSGYAFSARLANGCASVSTGSVFVTFYYKKFGYAHTTTVMVADSSNSGRTIANSIAALSVSNQTGTVQGVLAQQYWDVSIANTTSYAAPYLWMGVDNEGRGILVDSIKDLTSSIILSPINYGPGKYWYKVSTAGVPNSASRQERIFFHYTSCSIDSLRMIAGWNCSNYPTDPTTTCIPVSQYLKVAPSISQVQINMSRQAGNDAPISLCSTDSVTVIVNSAQASSLFAPSVTVYPPAGLTFSGTVPIEYPLGSGNWQNVTPVSLSGGGYQVNLSDHTGIGSTGLPGTALSPSSSGRQAKLKFGLSANCSFISGSQLDFFVAGNQRCGSAATGSGLDVKSNPINIIGATTTGSATVSLGISPAISSICTSNPIVSTTLTFVGTPSQIGDTATYTLPAGITYAGNFTGCAGCTINSTPGSGGTTIVKVQLPAGLNNTTPATFSFAVSSNGASGCGARQISVQVEHNISGVQCAATTCTASKTIIGSDVGSFTIQKPSLTITAFGVNSPGCVPGNSSTCTYNVSLTNAGTAAAPAGTYVAELFCGNNTTPVYTYTIANAIAVNATDMETFSVMTPIACAGQVVTLNIRFVTAVGAAQCLCSESSASILQVLPVTLTNFEAVATQCQVSLHWAVTEEENLSQYEIEYSEDGITFQNCGVVLAKGAGDYYFVHQPHLALVYYRLKILDKDGLFKYSSIRLVKLPCMDKQSVTVSPNPVATGTAILATVSGIDRLSNAMLVLRDATGKTLYRQPVAATGATVHIPTTGLSAGIYLLYLYNKNYMQNDPIRVLVK